MIQDLTLSDLETRIAFLEDQIDTLNHEIVFLNRDREKLLKELQALANLVRPLIDQISQLDVTHDSAPAATLLRKPMSNKLDDWIQTYPNFPKSGILFYDISPIIEQPDRLRTVCELIRDSVAEWKPDLLAGIDSRGFCSLHRSPS